jgi:hypothetical protein
MQSWVIGNQEQLEVFWILYENRALLLYDIPTRGSTFSKHY